MSRIEKRFAANKAEQKNTLIPFLTAGDPSKDVTVKAMHALVKAGADIIELGIPYSDPMADGPVIQHASERALAHGMSLAGVLECVAAFRESDTETGVVLMGYMNPIEAMGYEIFAARCADVGVDGVLVVDLPIEESQDLMPELKAQNIDPILLIAPTSTNQRIERAMTLAQGYLYYVSFNGITGALDRLDTQVVEQKISNIKAHGDLPIAVGFGIKDGESAKAIAQFADGVVVGSALVKHFETHQDNPDMAIEKAAELLGKMRVAIDTP